MIIETDLKLNTIESNFRVRVLAKQLDSNSRFLNCTFYNGDSRINVDQGTVVVNAKRADGESHSFAGSINEDGSVRVPIANWMTADPGMVTASVSVLGANDAKLTSASFVIDVQEAENPDGEVSPDDPNIDVALQIVSDAQAAADAAAASALEAAALAVLATITNAQIDALFE